jgi:GTPase SAR1 family protein
MPSMACFDIQKLRKSWNANHSHTRQICKSSVTDSDQLSATLTFNLASAEKESKKRSKQIEKELKRSGKVFKSTIKLLLLGTGESGKSTVLKQMRIIHTSKFSIEERREKINDIKSNIRDAILSILDSMERFNIRLENPTLHETREFLFDNIHYLIKPNGKSQLIYASGNYQKKKDSLASTNSVTEYSQVIEKLWDSIEKLWSDSGVKACAKRGNEYHLIDSAQYFLDRIEVIRRADYLPDDQDILRCRVLTTGITETSFFVKKVNFHIFDVGGQRDQRRKWIQCFNQVTAIIFIVDISSFNMTLREDHTVNRLKGM